MHPTKLLRPRTRSPGQLVGIAPLASGRFTTFFTCSCRGARDHLRPLDFTLGEQCRHCGVPGETLRQEASFPRSPGPGTKPPSEQTDGRGTRALCGRRRCVPILHKGSTYNRDLYKRAEGWGVVGPCQGATTTTGDGARLYDMVLLARAERGVRSRSETRKERREQGLESETAKGINTCKNEYTSGG